MRRTRQAISAALLGLFLLIPAAAQDQQYSTEYRIGPQDLLVINVSGVKEFDKLQVRVSEDGSLNLPLLGQVDVNNLTRSEVEAKLARLLDERQYLLNPQLTVFIQEYKSKRVSVLGAVENPGPFELPSRLTLLELISQAGGLNREAGNEIIIIRKIPGGESTALHISIEELFVKGDAKLNIPLEPGDIVNIPLDKLVNIYVWGQVRNPGVLQVKKSNLPTLTQAIAQAGGFTDRAAKGGVKITRKDPTGKEQEIKVNVKAILKNKVKDIQLQENDTVYVSETIF